MSVLNQAASQGEGHGGSHLVTEAQALCDLLGDLGAIPAVNLTNDTIFITTSDTMKAGAIEVLQIIAKRAADDEVFCDDAITAIGNCGYYLASAPAVRVEVKTAPAKDVLLWLDVCAIQICHGYRHDAERTPYLAFMPCAGRPVGSNAHLLMKIVAERFASEPEFARDMTQAAVNAGHSQHNA